jgi:hypothetical protein
LYSAGPKTDIRYRVISVSSGFVDPFGPPLNPATNAFGPIRHLRRGFFKEVRTPLQPPDPFVSRR